jgi:FkbM family methyltransferase
VDFARRERWRSRLGTAPGLRVGIAWAGSPEHVRDRYRSIPLVLLAPLLAIEGVQFHGLQKGPALAELNTLKQPNIVNLGPELADLADTAAVVGELDLVIAVDTAVAHLAGALAKPVWMMLPSPNDWRWLDARSDSPWYPTMRLFRQSRRNEWDDVIENVVAALRRRLREPVGVATAQSERPVAPPTPVLNATFPALAMRRPGFSALIDARAGLLQYLPSDGACGRSIEHYGEFLQPQLDLLGRIVGPGMTVLEVGAGIGAQALALSRAVGDAGNVIAYETRPIIRRLLRQNVRTNDAKNITIMPGEAKVHRLVTDASASSTAPAPPEPIDQLQLDRLDLLKIGVEGAPIDVVGGAADTLWRLRPVLFIAVSGETELNDVNDEAKQFGYRCWRVDTPLFNTDNFNFWEIDVFAGAVMTALLAIPEETDLEFDLSGCVELTR